MEKKAHTCCFSGYRAEKMPFTASDAAAERALCVRIREAICAAAAEGYTRFFTGMSTGFDLWAADAVLEVRRELPLTLCCALPFEHQADRFSLPWKQRFNRVLLEADQVYLLSREYQSGCYAARNRFMVDASSLLIAYFDGRPGGTAQTLRYAERQGVCIRNLAEGKLSLCPAP